MNSRFGALYLHVSNILRFFYRFLFRFFLVKFALELFPAWWTGH